MAHCLYIEDFDRADWWDCTAQGDVGGAVEYLVNRYRAQFERIPLANLRAHLREFGAWEDLEYVDADTLYQRLAFAEASTMLETGLVWID